MDQFAKETLPISLEDEMRRSYLDYAMSVIVGRALPDVRDGLKPVHRRVLFAMHELSNDYNKPYKKSARIPNLLINGSSGIAVGMATNIPPHNINEVLDACFALLKDPETGIEELIELVPAPDFPTAGIIYGTVGVKEGYRTGRGRVVMRGRTHVEDLERGGRQALIVDELPYQVNKKTFVEKIAELVNEKKNRRYL